MTPRLPDIVTSTLEEGRTAYVAVAAKAGPHVTPELYTWSGGRLWFAAATSTVKANVLGKRPEAGALVTGTGGTVVLRGDVEVLDPGDPASVIRSARDVPQTALALARFTSRNASDLLAFGVDTIAGRLGRRLPPMRVLFGLRPTAVAHIVNDAVAGAWGGWEGSISDADDHLVPAGGDQAVAAFPGPVPLPARWFADQDLAFVAPPVLALLDLPSSFPISVVSDAYRAPGPAAKQGVLLRGQARRAAGDPGYIELDADRLTTWDGVSTETASA